MKRKFKEFIKSWAREAAGLVTELETKFNSVKEADDSLISAPAFLSIVGLAPETMKLGGKVPLSNIETYVTIGVMILNFIYSSMKKQKEVKLSDLASAWQNGFTRLIDQDDILNQTFDVLPRLYNMVTPSYEELDCIVTTELNKFVSRKQLQENFMIAWIEQCAANHKDNSWEQDIEEGAGTAIIMVNNNMTLYIPIESWEKKLQELEGGNFDCIKWSVKQAYLDDVQKPKGTVEAMKRAFSKAIGGTGFDLGTMDYLRVESLPLEVRVKITLSIKTIDTREIDNEDLFHPDEFSSGGFYPKLRVVAIKPARKSNWIIKEGNQLMFESWRKSAFGHPTVKDLSIDTYFVTTQV